MGDLNPSVFSIDVFESMTDSQGDVASENGVYVGIDDRVTSISEFEVAYVGAVDGKLIFQLWLSRTKPRIGDHYSLEKV